MDLPGFLVEAKQNTYNSLQAIENEDLDDGAHQLSYRREGFHYRDKYFGEWAFSGQQTVAQDGKVVWHMIYTGTVVNPNFPKRTLGKFLQQAMRRVPADNPFRGPHRYQEGDLLYMNDVSGSVESFYGKEVISEKGAILFRLEYQGGLINGPEE